MSNWTTNNIPDLNGKVAIVTGANSGIGWDTAVALADRGATVIMACRNLAKSQPALDELNSRVPGAKVKLMHLDLASMASIHQFTDKFKEEYDRLNLLVNNAGIMMVPYGLTEDGFEQLRHFSAG